MVIFGASGHGKVILDILQASGEFSVEKFLDDNPSAESFCNLLSIYHLKRILMRR
ncbi:PglD-related sugar-binding protein [Ornithobacterium rhinotracheale]|uniref:PglD-related sugar-binding protein n=1 Tax=Ornithobacterium rhinotracheale TaxID=28251 RepID=UPI00293E9E40|nr:hypothetical protein [Ornithobacterium rhinotracheale]